MADPIVGKRCCRCKETKPTEAFARNRSARDGFQFRCRTCHNKAMHAYQTSAKGRANCRRRALAFQKTAKGRANSKRCRSRQKAKGATHAHDAVKYAVRTGRLAPIWTQRCRQCGRPAEHYHHHQGYAPEHRLHVTPLCTICHKAESKPH